MTKQRLMERAGLTNEAELNFLPLDDTTHHIVFNNPKDAERKLDSADIDYDNVGFVFPKMTRETWMTIKDLFDTRDVGDMGQHNESVTEKQVLDLIDMELKSMKRGLVATPDTRAQLERFADANQGCSDIYVSDIVLMQMAIQFGYKMALETIQHQLQEPDPKLV